MMILQSNFPIHLQSFSDWLKQYPEIDGITTEDNVITVIAVSDLSEQVQQQIIAHFNSLDEYEELSKIQRPTLLKNSVMACKQNIVTKDITTLVTYEKKLLMGLPLTREEEDTIISIYGET